MSDVGGMSRGSSSSRPTSMFNQTCERLREYLKERGPLAARLTLPIIDPTTTTMNLFPTAATNNNDDHNNNNNNNNNSKNVGEDHVHDDGHEMTIFYGGRIIVLQNVSPDKANEVMRLATTTSPQPPSSHQLPHAFVRDLSLKRSRSLTRFFEKRKDRINARAPYALKVNNDKQPWLALASAASNL